jgi:hypothetical protein
MNAPEGSASVNVERVVRMKSFIRSDENASTRPENRQPGGKIQGKEHGTLNGSS